MAVLKVLQYPDPKLKMKSEAVEVIDDATLMLLDNMLETMYAHEGCGLAAIQVGVAKRLLVMDVSDEGDSPAPIRIINPEILWKSEETFLQGEGCLSVPGVYDKVPRSSKIRVRYMDETRQTLEIEATGLLAGCFQHEVEHLEGILFPEKFSRLKKEMLLRKSLKVSRQMRPM